jgi:hypothetical protein
MQLNFAAAGFLFLAAVMTGCLNPVSFNTFPAADETLPGAAMTGADKPVAIRLLLDDGAASGVSGSRAVVGPDYDRIAEGPGMLNYVQVFAYDENNQVVAAVDYRVSPDNEGINYVEIKGLNFTDLYTFLVLIGHWQRDYDAGKGMYMEEASPTLVAVGYEEGMTAAKNGEIEIELSTIQVDTKFTSSKGDVVEVSFTDSANKTAPKPEENIDNVDDWNVEWSIKETNGFKYLFNAAKKDIESLEDGDFEKVFLEAKGIFRRSDTTIPNNPVTTALTTSYSSPRKLTLPIEKTGGSNDVTGSVNFNLVYKAFNGLEDIEWDNVEEPATEWIIRNGINDEPQNAATTFKKDVTWTGTTADKPNGNGAVTFKIGVNFGMILPIVPE